MINEQPSAENLIQKAHALIPFLKNYSLQHDREKRISDDVANKIRQEGFFKICQSVENGGYGMRPSVLWRVSREVGRGDSSTAWILSLAGLHPWMAGMFSPDTQDEVFTNGKDAVVIALTGNVGRGVTVERSGDSYILSGKWSYASGIDVADWAATLVEAPDEKGSTELRLLLIPKTSFQIDHDSWNVLGMRGTGSKDVHLNNEVVSVKKSILWSDIQTMNLVGKERNKGPMYDIPHTSLFVMSVAAAINSVASGLLDIYIDTVKKRIPAGLKSPQTQDRFTLADLGKAASQLDMAFNQLIHDVDEMWDQSVAKVPFSIEQRAKYRSNGAMIANTTMQAVDSLVKSIGGSLLPNGPLEKYFRDLHSMASHFLMQSNHSGELYGIALLDLPMPTNARI